MRRVTGIVTIALVLAVGTMLGPALLVAEAHSCSAQNPAKSCGECTSGTHTHNYLNGDPYCYSAGGGGGDFEIESGGAYSKIEEGEYAHPVIERSMYTLPKMAYALQRLGFFQ